MTLDASHEPISALTALDDVDVTELEFDELDAILTDLRTRNDETPQWEFCEGFMAALICSRRTIHSAEYLPVLLGFDPAHPPTTDDPLGLAAHDLPADSGSQPELVSDAESGAVDIELANTEMSRLEVAAASHHLEAQGQLEESALHVPDPIGVSDPPSVSDNPAQGGQADQLGSADEGGFASAEQAARFKSLWYRRWNEVADALDEEVDNLQDDAAYHPEVMDVRGAFAAMPAQERLDIDLGSEALPSLAQVWALGFMYCVESWPQEWAAPRDKETAEWLDEALDAIVALTEDDEGEPSVAVFSDDGPPSVSKERIEAFGNAIWAVYDLRELWRSIGPRVITLRKDAMPGRNDLCFCGSGKKYKRCHGA